MNFQRYFTFCILVFLCAVSRLDAEYQVTGYRLQSTGLKTSSSSQISVSDYCLFLNAVAVSDPYVIYDEKMGSQSTDYRLQASGSETAAACSLIIRSGKPGDYYYLVADGKENSIMSYIDKSSAQHYFNWLEHSDSAFCSCDLFSVTCQLFSASTLTLNLNSSEVTGRPFAACDEQLRSNRLGLYKMQEVSALAEKSSGKGATGTSLGKIVLGVGTVLVAVEEAGEAHSAASISTEERQQPLTTIDEAQRQSAQITEQLNAVKAGSAKATQEKSERFIEAAWQNSAYHLTEANGYWLLLSQTLTEGNTAMVPLGMLPLLRRMAEQHQLLAEHHRHVADATIEGNKEEEHAARESSYRLGQARIYFGKTIKANSKNEQETVNLCQMTAEQHLLAAEGYRKMAAACSRKNREEEDSLFRVASCAGGNALCLNDAVAALEKATETKNLNRLEEAFFYQKSSDQHQAAVRYAQRSPKEVTNYQERERWNNASKSTRQGAAYLSYVALELEKATQASKEKNPEKTIVHQKRAECYKRAAEYYRQSAEAYASENKQAGILFYHAGESIGESASHLMGAASALEKAAEVGKKNQIAANFYRESAEQSQRAADSYRMSAEAYAQGNQAEGDRLGGAKWSHKQGAGWVASEAAEAFKREADKASKTY